MTDEDKKPYHTIMTAAWRLFIKERKTEQFSDEWWKELIGDYDKLREPYRGTIYDDYCGDVNQAFLDQWERIQKSSYPKKEIYEQQTLPLEESKEFTVADWG
jgi:hypothetical protein